MKHRSRLAFVISLFAIFFMCSRSVAVAQVDRASPLRLRIVDQRPATDRTTLTLLSNVRKSCDYLVVRMDDAFVPDRFMRLEHALSSLPSLSGQTVHVLKFAIFSNREAHATKRRNRVAIGAALGGAIGGAVAYAANQGVNTGRPTISPKCQRDQMSGGWFDVADISNDVSPLTVDVTVSVDGKVRSGNAAGSFKSEKAMMAAAEVETLAESTMDRALERLAAEIAKDMP